MLQFQEMNAKWKEQLENLITDPKELGLADSPLCLLPMAVTPYYASLIRQKDFSDPIFAQCVPSPQEAQDERKECDPLCEEKFMPVPGLIRRYPDRAVFLASSRCAVQCRHCTRRWQIINGKPLDYRTTLSGVLNYLKKNPDIEEIIVSGGDPLALEDFEIEEILSAFKNSGIKVMRLGTRFPATLPMRVTKELVSILAKYQPLWIQTHFNHPWEITKEAKEALALFCEAGLPINNQTVLLKGVNDNAETLEKLFRLLIQNRVRPYYLFQCDKIPGTERFWTPLEKGVEIERALRARLSGIAIPTFILDQPANDGKIPLSFATAEKNELKIF